MRPAITAALIVFSDDIFEVEGTFYAPVKK
jgi:hypothetical protein